MAAFDACLTHRDRSQLLRCVVTAHFAVLFDAAFMGVMGGMGGMGGMASRMSASRAIRDPRSAIS